MQMKKYISLSIFGFIILNLSGCYTQLLVEDNSYDKDTIIVYYPEPQPCPYPFPPPPVPDPIQPTIFPYDPPAPEQPVEKYRQPEPPKPPSNDRIRNPLRNTGERIEKDKGRR